MTARDLHADSAERTNTCQYSYHTHLRTFVPHSYARA